MLPSDLRLARCRNGCIVGCEKRDYCRSDGNPTSKRRPEGHADPDGPTGCREYCTSASSWLVSSRSLQTGVCTGGLERCSVPARLCNKGLSRWKCLCAGYCGTSGSRLAPYPVAGSSSISANWRQAIRCGKRQKSMLRAARHCGESWRVLNAMSVNSPKRIQDVVGGCRCPESALLWR